MLQQVTKANPTNESTDQSITEEHPPGLHPPSSVLAGFHRAAARVASFHGAKQHQKS